VTRKPKAIRVSEARGAEAASGARHDGRTPTQARPLKIERGVMPHAEGSAMVRMGRTRVLCTASVEDKAPGWMRGQGKGWVTAEYGMLPRATTTSVLDHWCSSAMPVYLNSMAGDPPTTVLRREIMW